MTSKPTKYSDRTEWHNEAGELHREDGPAIEWEDVSKSYYINGKPHRTDGPAVEWADGYKSYYINGKRHRTDGPAIVWEDVKEYWVEGKEYNYFKYCLKKWLFKLIFDR